MMMKTARKERTGIHFFGMVILQVQRRVLGVESSKLLSLKIYHGNALPILSLGEIPRDDRQSRRRVEGDFLASCRKSLTIESYD